MKQLLLLAVVLCLLFAVARGTSHFCNAAEQIAGDDCTHNNGIVEVCEQQAAGLACVANKEICSSKEKGADCSTDSRPNMKCSCPSGNDNCSELICAPVQAAAKKAGTKEAKKVTKKQAKKKVATRR